MSKRTKILLLSLSFLAVIIWANIAKSPADQTQEAVQLFLLNVGQGDAILIQKADYQILIDGGPDDKVLSELGKTMPPSDRKIEEVVLTHPHADHLRGLISVVDRYEIGKIRYTGASYESNGYKEFLDKIKQKNIPLDVPELGDKETLFPGGEVTYLWPGKKFEEKTEQNLNNVSLVMRFCYFSHCALLTGDQEVDEQKEMFGHHVCHPELVSGSPQTCLLSADLLKLSHHGSANGANELTFDTVKPKMAAISVGAENKYGHPHQGVIDLLGKYAVPYYRTDQNGTVKFVFTEQGIVEK